MKLLLSTYLAALTTTFCAVVAVPAATNDLVERASCNFSGSSGASEAIARKNSCSSITLSNVEVPAGTTLDLTGLNDGTQVIFDGTTTFGYKEWTGPMISISGTNIQISGSSGHLIDGGGSRWWDGQGGNGGKIKPKFFAAHNLNGNSAIAGLHIQNTPVQVYSISGSSGLTITNPIVDNKAGDALGGHNTDAFDIGSSDHITITGAQVYNQDDCVAVNSGSNIIFSGGYCSGGHGLSIGSVGGRSDNTVDNVQFLSSHVVNSENGVRIKTVKGATGSVNGVTYKDITLQNITKYGVVIAQNYDGGSFSGTPTTNVPISGLTLNNVQGTVASSGTNIMIECGSSSSCSGWNWGLVNVSGGRKDICTNAPSGTC